MTTIQTRKASASAFNLDGQDTPDSALITFTDKTVARVAELRGALEQFDASSISVFTLPGLEVHWLDEDGAAWEDTEGIRLRTPVARVYRDQVVYTVLTRDDDGSVVVRFDTKPEDQAAAA